MILNMFKIAGELTSTVFHVSARTLATHALSIFGDHSDVMATDHRLRSARFSFCTEAHDFALISQAATLEARIPSCISSTVFVLSEVNKIEQLTFDDMRR
jgi:pyruvate-ferredoxin/flavodoxin oxidoreductase